MRVIVAAAGPQTKWGGHRGVPSHLVPVDGDPLLHRTVAQARRHSDDVHVTGPPGDDRYAVAGAAWHERDTGHPSEYHSTRDLWSDETRTVLLYGDVYFTDAAITTIMGDTGRTFKAFGRTGRSRYTGCRYGELFAASWWPEDHATVDRHLDVALSQRAGGTTRRPVCWLLLNSIQGRPPKNRRHSSRFWVEIDDLTEDFDFPADYDQHPASTTLSVVVMAHPDRAEWAQALSADLGCGIVYDRGQGLWDTARRSMEAYDPEATHHVIVQDDAILCEGFRGVVSEAAASAGMHPLGLYIGNGPRGGDRRRMIQAASAAYRKHQTWVRGPGPLWAVATVHPVSTIPKVLDLAEQARTKADDDRYTHAYRQMGVDCWYPVPSLVDHRDDIPSLLNNPVAGKGRVAVHFRGTDTRRRKVEGMATFVNIRSPHLDPITVPDDSASCARLSRLVNVWERVDVPEPADLSRKLKAELVEMADARGLDTSGKKADLIARLT